MTRGMLSAREKARALSPRQKNQLYIERWSTERNLRICRCVLPGYDQGHYHSCVCQCEDLDPDDITLSRVCRRESICR